MMDRRLERLLHITDKLNMRVEFASFKSDSKGLCATCDDGIFKIGIRASLPTEEYIETLAHELAYYFLHYDKGDTITSDKHEEYEEQADRAAKMLLTALSIV